MSLDKITAQKRGYKFKYDRGYLKNPHDFIGEKILETKPNLIKTTLYTIPPLVLHFLNRFILLKKVKQGGCFTKSNL